MALGIRKLVVLILVAGIFFAANIMIVAHWLQEMGVIDAARNLREEFLTGTAITIIIALLILLVKPGNVAGKAWISGRRCPVCNHRIGGSAKYCDECGSKA